MKYCAVQGCVNPRNGQVPLYRFPKASDPYRFLKWVIFTRRAYLKDLFFDDPQRMRSVCRICNDHFTDCCFMNSLRKQLVHDAVPTLFSTISAEERWSPKVGLRLENENCKNQKVYFPVSVHELQELMVQQSFEMELFVARHWKTNGCKMKTTICVPHEHKRLPLLCSPNILAHIPVQIPENNRRIELYNSQSAFHMPKILNQDMSRPESLLRKTLESRNISLPICAEVPNTHNDCAEDNGIQICDDEIKVDPDSLHAYYVCCAAGCTSTNKICRLFPFPAKSSQAEIWLERCQRQDLIPFLRLNGAVPNNFLLCRRHFADHQFVNFKDEMLKVNSVPVYFPGINPVKCQQSKINYIKPADGHLSHSIAISSRSPIKLEELRMKTCIPQGPFLHLQRLQSADVTLEFCAEHEINLSSGEKCKKKLTFFEEQKTLWKFHPKRKIKKDNLKRKQIFHSSMENDVSCEAHCADKTCGASATLDNQLFQFPFQTLKCLSWLENLGDPHLLSYFKKHGAKACFSNLYLCSLHFQPSCFYTRVACKRLVAYAVPTLFLHGRIRHPCVFPSLDYHYSNDIDSKRWPVVCTQHTACIEVTKLRNNVSLEEEQYLARKKIWLEKMASIKDKKETADKEEIMRRRSHAPAWHSPEILEYDSTPFVISEEVESGEVNRTALGWSQPTQQDYFVPRNVTATKEDNLLSVANMNGDTSLYTSGNRKGFSGNIMLNDLQYPASYDQLTELHDFNVEISKLRSELHLLRSKCYKYGATIKQVRDCCRSAQFRLHSEQVSVKEAMLYCKSRMSDYGYEFLVRQHLTTNRPLWNSVSIKIPIIIHWCSIAVRRVLHKIFTLPLISTVGRYKARARQNPGMFRHCPLMRQLVQKHYRSKFIRASARGIDDRKPRKRLAVSEIIKNYIKRNKYEQEYFQISY